VRNHGEELVLGAVGVLGLVAGELGFFVETGTIGGETGAASEFVGQFAVIIVVSTL
jgi:hypothetical protein